MSPLSAEQLTQQVCTLKQLCAERSERIQQLRHTKQPASAAEKIAMQQRIQELEDKLYDYKFRLGELTSVLAKTRAELAEAERQVRYTQRELKENKRKFKEIDAALDEDTRQRRKTLKILDDQLQGNCNANEHMSPEQVAWVHTGMHSLFRAMPFTESYPGEASKTSECAETQPYGDESDAQSPSAERATSPATSAKRATSPATGHRVPSKTDGGAWWSDGDKGV